MSTSPRPIQFHMGEGGSTEPEGRGKGTKVTWPGRRGRRRRRPPWPTPTAGGPPGRRATPRARRGNPSGGGEGGGGQVDLLFPGMSLARTRVGQSHSGATPRGEPNAVEYPGSTTNQTEGGWDNEFRGGALMGAGFQVLQKAVGNWTTPLRSAPAPQHDPGYALAQE